MAYLKYIVLINLYKKSFFIVLNTLRGDLFFFNESFLSVIKYDIRKILNLFLPKSFDIVLILDVLEHLKRKESLKLLRDAEKIAKKAVIIETPLGFIPQNIDIWKMGGDKYQTHRSSWDIRDFEVRGYKSFLRSYKMSNVKRHTKHTSNLNVKLINAIKTV